MSSSVYNFCYSFGKYRIVFFPGVKLTELLLGRRGRKGRRGENF